jgi:hypothetical protein
MMVLALNRLGIKFPGSTRHYETIVLRTVYFGIAPKADADSTSRCIPANSRLVPRGDLSRCGKLPGIRNLRGSCLQTSLRRAAAGSFFRLVFRFQLAEVFLDHTQMDPKPVQVDFECACNLKRAHG